MHNVDTLNICMKEFGSQKLIIGKMTVMRTWTIFPDCVGGYSSTCAMIVHTRADILSQLLMDSLNTLLSHYIVWEKIKINTVYITITCFGISSFFR